MTRTVGEAAIVFVALAVVGIFFVVSPGTITSVPGDMDAFRSIGTAMFAAGLTAFLVEAFRWDEQRRHA